MHLMLFMLLAPAFAVEPRVVDLGSTHQRTWGDEAASALNDILPVLCRLAGYEINLLVGFNREKKVVEVVLFGSRTTLDGAKASTDEFRTKVLEDALGVLERSYGVALAPTQYRVSYVNHETKKVVLTLEAGKYTVP